ncbi:MAG: M23 family metallopeptidase [Pseudomonadota bacterium]
MSLRFILFVLSASGLAACVLRPTGYSAPYATPQPFAVVVPQNAPSISQQYRNAAQSDRHLGSDFIARIGTPVLAAASGEVTRSFFDPAYGHTVEMSHGQSDAGQPIVTRYTHLKSRSVAALATVQRGQQIGTLGRSGILAGGIAHLHFEVWIGSGRDLTNARDPNLYWVDGSGIVTCYDPARTVPGRPFSITHPVVCQGR